MKFFLFIVFSLVIICLLMFIIYEGFTSMVYLRFSFSVSWIDSLILSHNAAVYFKYVLAWTGQQWLSCIKITYFKVSAKNCYESWKIHSKYKPLDGSTIWWLYTFSRIIEFFKIFKLGYLIKSVLSWKSLYYNF